MHALYIFFSIMLGWRHQSWNMLEITVHMRYKLQQGPVWGHTMTCQWRSQPAPAIPKPTQTTLRSPTRCQGRQRGSKGSGKENSSHSGLKTRSWGEAALCHRAAQLTGRKAAALGTPAPELLWGTVAQGDRKRHYTQSSRKLLHKTTLPG